MQPLHLRRFWIAGGAALIASVLYAALVRAGDAPDTGLDNSVEHAGCFLVLTLWFSGIALRRFCFVVGAALFLFGVAIEWAQQATALGRVADAADLAANSVGIATGLGLAFAGLGDWMQRVEVRLLRR
jgi:hypothetical protein